MRTSDRSRGLIHTVHAILQPGATQGQVRVIRGSIAAKHGGERRDLDDQDLMARLAAGDEKAFEALLDRLELGWKKGNACPVCVGAC